MNNLNEEKRLNILHLLLEGNSIRSTARLTGVHKCTIAKHLVAAGKQARQTLDKTVRKLTLRHVQADEIWTFVGKKQGHLRVEERDNPYVGDMYLWVALDEDTKLIPTFRVGKRSADMARRFMMDLASRLVFPPVSDVDAHAYQPGRWEPIVTISTDGFAGYPEAVDLAFGPYARYGQCIKNYRNADQPGRYAPPEMIQTEKRAIFGSLREGEICTSHVERNNLTIRTFIRRFTRLSLGFSKKLENLIAAVALHVGYYNLCRRHSAHRLTPAMKAGITNHVWTLPELLAA